jgi:two-component system OmpR family sensor kinase/two-component system sensor histidine kinase BaeS
MRALARSFNTMTERLQHSDRLRRNLTADLAHELRTPLSILQGRLEGLLDGVYPRDDRQIAEVLDETRFLSRLIEDLRTLAVSEAGALPLHRDPMDLVPFVHEVVGIMDMEARRKSITLSVAASVDSVIVNIDSMRIREVLTNLVTNAIRHTPINQGVTISVSQRDRTAIVAVADTGEGMPPDELARIFDRFYKGATSRGSGLGLTIAKGIIAAHGGEITASSQPGRGTTVTFTLPQASAS